MLDLLSSMGFHMGLIAALTIYLAALLAEYHDEKGKTQTPMPWDESGEYRPYRRDPEGRRCNHCNRVFAAGCVPVPYLDGTRLCTDCRAIQYEMTYQ
ncbi:hypothetical protein VH15_05895 [Corynebacterium ulcerans]|nr:hypothetical protein VH15_05895 [Corynebacterium ulcerans]